ncbi:hypothetical protein [Mucilaginibacter flavus]|uniref:hypothetical protein n=1 Tax=Mucilaginibacter flavus TaxID=931504 RepID=UPI0025B621C9|nr:hypothetical protein [Mucilaginibacter flavus]MDN3580540.1 hypothetical protein [Mucilaginibacter flavus]
MNDTDSGDDKYRLSTWTTAVVAKRESKEPIAKINIAPFRSLRIKIDYRENWHATIRPATPEELERLAASKEGLQHGKEPHIYTRLAQASVRGIE